MPFRKRRQSQSDLIELFEQSYGQLRTPVFLCSGLEILAANQATSSVLNIEPDSIVGGLIGSLLTKKTDAELIFETNSNPLEVKLETGTGMCPRICSVRAQRWELHPNLWLLDWVDLTEAKSQEEKFKRTQQYDQILDVLLPASFDYEVAEKLETLSKRQRRGLLFSVALTPAQANQNSTKDFAAQFVETIRSQFGSDTILGRSESATAMIFCSLSNNDEESRFILNQVRRISRTISSNYRINVCSYPADGQTIAQLRAALNLAEQAPAPKDKLVVYDDNMEKAGVQRLQLSMDMKEAINSNEIQPHYQPIIHSETGQLKGFEALVRWFHPECGFIPPPEIISIATDIGLLDELTNHILATTTRQIQKWPETVQFAVNITPSQICADLVDTVRQTVRSAKIDPKRLEIEITEEALIDGFEYSTHIFARLRAIGVSIAMDDFGSGYTSVGNLRKLNFTKIKIDKIISDGLPHDSRSVAIVRSLMFMARELEVDITVEGIETEEQLEFLRAFNCGVQGYVLSKPVAIKDMPQFRKFIAPQQSQQKDKTIVGIGPRKSQSG